MNDLKVNDLATGWLKGGNVLGRAVDVIMNDDEVLFVSDDNGGRYVGCIMGSRVLDLCFNSELDS